MILTETIELVSSLLLLIPTIPSFKGKWSLISQKLTLLHSHLSNSLSNNNNPLFLHFLHSLSLTLNDAVSLANQCPSQGKLKTQNDLDSLLSSLHHHLHDSHILLSQQPDSPNDLITRLQLGSLESRIPALDSLLDFIHDNDKNVVILVSQGIVPVLLRLLDSTSSDVKDKTLAAISVISAVDCGENDLFSDGLLLLNHLLRVLDSGSAFAKEKACVILQSLSFSKENATAIGSRGGVSSLLKICDSGTPVSQAYAAGVLRNLAGFKEIKENLVEENAVSVLLGLVSSGTASAQENAIGCLCNLVSGEESLKLLVVKEGGVLQRLKNFWDSGQNLEVKVQLLELLALNQKIAEVLVEDGFVPLVVEVLNCGVMAVRISAAKILYALGFNIPKAKKLMCECGCITLLIKMLDGKSDEEKEEAAKALSMLMLNHENRRAFRKDERGIVSAVQLLDPELKDLDKRYPVALLASLVNSKNSRKQMVAAGACVYMQKLVEMDVEGSKKLLESLGRAKIWGVF